MSDFDWNSLRSFLAVARTGRLTTAARTLGVDHTTLSRRIAGLEEALKVKLFERHPSGYRLTNAGDRLLLSAETMESIALTTQSQIGGEDLAVTGAVRIGAPEGFGSNFLASRIAALCHQHPQLEIQLVAMPRLFSLSKREADIAISLAPPREGRLVARKLTDYRLRLYAAPAYLATLPPIKSIEDLRDCRFIGYIDDLIYSQELDYLGEIASFLSPQLKSANLIAQLNAAITGTGICVLPDFIARGCEGLVPVLPSQVSLMRSFWLVTHADLRGLARIKTVSAFISNEVKTAQALFKPCDD
ncbi:LysR family transcriptional regulator [Beijerinckia indica]|uniref:Transcriptional regulator, LysR family n=1 Tax=Beijerinckia indica subsp. indica (strain ATCC 9039 / DSM 1715 / NCIMB 8712) TaxID=395963 RepID=B2IFQ8_BEII9|nr:LysR family transcriptional regulator [Beijerinckia indica]ACB94269.1 transcriptional regulator, LysR family [Beijerinckia indica subsp. indica ATCC 9039]